MASPVIEGCVTSFRVAGISENTPIANSDAADLIDQWGNATRALGAGPWSMQTPEVPHRSRTESIVLARRSIRAAATVFSRLVGRQFPVGTRINPQARAERRGTRRPAAGSEVFMSSIFEVDASWSVAVLPEQRHLPGK